MNRKHNRSAQIVAGQTMMHHVFYMVVFVPVLFLFISSMSLLFFFFHFSLDFFVRLCFSSLSSSYSIFIKSTMCVCLRYECRLEVPAICSWSTKYNFDTSNKRLMFTCLQSNHFLYYDFALLPVPKKIALKIKR